jgi:N-acyl-D-amino-acid deacylase
MRVGRTLLAQRAEHEVMYYARGSPPPAVVPPLIGKKAPMPYGAWYLEAMEAHGGWIASAVDLVRFASAFDNPLKCKVLSAPAILRMFACPDGPAGHQANGALKDSWYGCGWEVRPAGNQGAVNTWPTGLLDGTSSLLVRRSDGLDWAVLFNIDRGPKNEILADVIDPLVHKAADAIRRWPDADLFARYL